MPPGISWGTIRAAQQIQILVEPGLLIRCSYWPASRAGHARNANVLTADHVGGQVWHHPAGLRGGWRSA
jgi:hypothetical protein